MVDILSGAIIAIISVASSLIATGVFVRLRLRRYDDRWKKRYQKLAGNMPGKEPAPPWMTPKLANELRRAGLYPPQVIYPEEVKTNGKGMD